MTSTGLDLSRILDGEIETYLRNPEIKWRFNGFATMYLLVVFLVLLFFFLVFHCGVGHT